LFKTFEEPLTRSEFNRSDMDFSMAQEASVGVWVCMESSRSRSFGPETCSV